MDCAVKNAAAAPPTRPSLCSQRIRVGFTALYGDGGRSAEKWSGGIVHAEGTPWVLRILGAGSRSMTRARPCAFCFWCWCGRPNRRAAPVPASDGRDVYASAYPPRAPRPIPPRRDRRAAGVLLASLSGLAPGSPRPRQRRLPHLHHRPRPRNATISGYPLPGAFLPS